MYRAGILLRAAAAVIDLLAAGLLFALARLATGLSPNVVPQERMHAARGAFCFLWILYTSMEVSYAGTPGKLLMGLRIGRQNGREADFETLLFRWSTKYYWLLPLAIDYFYWEPNLRFFIVLLMVVMSIGWIGAVNDDCLTWHDLWTGTAVWAQQRQPKRSRSRARTSETRVLQTPGKSR